LEPIADLEHPITSGGPLTRLCVKLYVPLTHCTVLIQNDTPIRRHTGLGPHRLMDGRFVLWHRFEIHIILKVRIVYHEANVETR
jgi:hypothetical protein